MTYFARVYVAVLTVIALTISTMVCDNQGTHEIASILFVAGALMVPLAIPVLVITAVGLLVIGPTRG